jgi:hypothetical protein
VTELGFARFVTKYEDLKLRKKKKKKKKNPSWKTALKQSLGHMLH